MPSERVQRRIDDLLDQVEQAVSSRDWVSVLEVVAGVLEADPGNEDGLTFKRMAKASLSQGGQDPPAFSHAGPTESVVSSALDVEPTSFASGRYTVSRFLGEGGKKKVYLAHDNTLDRDVAFALIKTEGLDATSRERVTREAQAMGRMGTHPCIMPIYDLGEEPDANGVAQPFMVQPLMGGGDVEGLIEDADGPLPLEDAIRIATQTAQGLVFAHSKGIVHRDLKSGNVWLEEDGSARIGDFGLAVATDRSRLTVEKMMVGTVNYMPPEQATGGEVTPKADLYSLGAMLYEMSTGRVPFMGDDDIAVISQHVNTPPVAPSWHNALIPKTLDSLILRMMSKDPAERPVDAEEVLVALNAVDLSAVEERDESGKGSLDAMAGGVFVGRHKEMDQLKAGFEEVLSGKGRMVTLVGEPGIGKTRTAHELATYAAMRGAAVLWGRSYESGGAPPYWPWVQAIRSHVAETDPQVLRNQMGSTAPVIAEIVSDIREKLPNILAATPIEDPESARFRLFDSISTFLKNTASGTPLVLMLEDLHWSDKPSLMLLEFVARELANSRIMIVGNYRDMELNRRHPLSVTLGDLSRERLFERVVLRGLQRHDVERFIEIAAGITPPAALVDAVFKQTEGNPLFVTETVRLLVQEGDITSGSPSKGGTTSWEIRIPEGVREVIGRRLDRLSERCNEVLTIAAVIGRQFRFNVLKMLSEDSTDNQLLDAMDEALSARIVEELPDEVGLYQFTHAQMQETLTDELSANRRVRMHARIAEALEGHYGDQAEGHAAELAEHFAEAETVLGAQKLVRYSLAAGEQALKQFSYSDAVGWFKRISESGYQLSDQVKPRYHFLFGRALLAVSELPESFVHIQQAFWHYLNAGDTDQALAVAGTALPYYGNSDHQNMLIEASKHTVPGTIQEARILSRLGSGYSGTGADYELVIDSLERSLEVSRNLEDHNLTLWTLARSMMTATGNTDTALALRRAKELETVIDKGDDYAAITNAQLWAGNSYKTNFDIQRAGELFEQAIQSAESSHQAVRLGQALVNRGRWHRSVGNWDAAKSDFRRTIETGWANDVPHAELSMLSAMLGDLPEAEKHLENAIGLDDREGPWAFVTLHARMIVDLSIGKPHDKETVSAYEELRRLGMRNSFISDGFPIAYSMVTGKEWEDVIKRLVPRSGQLVSNLPSQPPVDHILGIGFRSLGKLDRSIEMIGKSVKRCREQGLRPFSAESSALCAEVLLERNAAADRVKAIELQDEAIAIATELGMKPLLERVLAKREILKA